MTESMARLPELITHADWGIARNKRWMASARLSESGRCCASAPEVVGESATLLGALRAQVGPQGCALLGFDFPIGLPHK